MAKKPTKAQLAAAAKAAADKKAADQAQAEQMTADIAAAEAAIATAKEAAAALTEEAEKTKAQELITGAEKLVQEKKDALAALQATLAEDTKTEEQAAAAVANAPADEAPEAAPKYSAEQTARIAEVFNTYTEAQEVYVADDKTNIFLKKDAARMFALERKKPYTTVLRADYVKA